MLHAELEPLGFLLGTWVGEGNVHYPTIEAVDYGEQLRFTHVGKPFLAYTQRSWALADGRPLAASSGYWRCKDGDRVELVLAHPTGIAEVATGTVAGREVRVSAVGPQRTPTAKLVERLDRVLVVDGETLTSTIWMAAVGQPLQEHLAARLTRAPAETH
jgi:hypothetical protein